MFQLIAAVLAIALIILVAIAAVWFGGSVFDESKARADYARDVNGATQIEAAYQLYFHDHGHNPVDTDMTLLQEFVDWGYLKDLPKGDWKVSKDAIYKPVDVQEIAQCRAMNKAAGYDISTVPAEYNGCPPCNGTTGSQQLTDAESYKNWPGCQFVN